jgi:exopolysaccharide production protein ExoZ
MKAFGVNADPSPKVDVRRATHRFQTIQALRFVAAFMVVVTHATFIASTRVKSTVPIWHEGEQGVGLFFVISGFVMLLSANALIGTSKPAQRFVVSRIIRIVPLYWTLNFLKIAQVAIAPSLALAHPTVSNIVLSMLFIPSRNADGVLENFYGVGWTLNFEAFFYMLVTLALVFRVRIIYFVAAVLIPAAALSLVRTEDWPAITSLFRPLLLDFLWGIVIGELWLARLRPHLATVLVLLGAGATLMFVAPTDLLGLQFAFVVAGAVFLEPYVGSRVPRLLTFGGDASYALYLIHPAVGPVVAIVLGRFVQSAPVLIALIIVACVLSSAIVYLSFERPVTRMLKKRFLSRAAKPAFAGFASTTPG